MKPTKLLRTRLKSYLRSDGFLISCLAFGLPFLSMLCVFAGNQIYPFGDRSFLRTDLYHQYAPFFAELQRKLKEGSSLYFTWNIGMGTNFISLIGYYLSSIFNWPVLFCSQDNVLEFISYLVIFKMGLAGLSFSWLLKQKGPEDDYRIPFFSVFYAMSGYLAAYSWNIMWLDCVWLAPLILLGIEQLIFRKKYLLYIASLSMAIISNYYIAIMLCIFCVLYFLIQLPSLCFGDYPSEDRKKAVLGACIRFAGASLMAGALSACILIPEIKALSLTASSDINFPTEWKSYFSTLEMIARHLINVDIENGLDHWPNIYCGVAVFICLPLYYLNKKIALSKKITHTALLLFMLFSFAVNVPNFIWHGFHYPNSLPCRQSFLYTAVLLVMCYEGTLHLKARHTRWVGLAFGAAAAFIFLCEFTMTDDAFHSETYWLSLLFLGIYAVLFLCMLKDRLRPAVLAVLLLVTVFAEVTVNMACTSVTTVSRSEYLNYREPYQALIEEIQELDSGFYRFEKVARKTKNDGAFVGYPSISTFSSVSYGSVSDFYDKLGMESSMNAYSNNGITPLMNSLLAVKYILTTASQQESQLMTLCTQNEDCYIYENLYTMSAGFMLPKGFQIDWDIESGNIIDIQNSFSLLNGHDELFYEIYDYSINGNEMDLNVSEDCHIYVEMNGSGVDTVEADISGTSKKFTHVKRGFLLDLGYCSPDDTITLTAPDSSSIDATAYYVNESALISLIRDLKEEELQVTEWTERTLGGTIEAEEDGMFFLSIPFDPGWKVLVDGKVIDYHTFKEAFICFDLSEGTHSIELRYTPDGLYSGLLISAGALILLIVFETARRKQLLFRKKQPADINNVK